MAPQSANVQQPLATGISNMSINNEQSIVSVPQASNVPSEPVQTPPPFLSGVPMVNPGNYVTAKNAEKPQQQLILQQQLNEQPTVQQPSIQQSDTFRQPLLPTQQSFSLQSDTIQPSTQQTVPQTHSMVSNMAAYSSNLADASLANLGSIPSVSSMQPPAPLPNLPGIPMNQPQPYIPMMPNYSQSQSNVLPTHTQSAVPLVPTFDMSNFPSSTAISSGIPVVTPVSLPGMPSITVSATLPISTMKEIHHQQSQHQDLLS
ncbi:hypothetical protein ACJJTC_004411 [Scirpophaga incertulas]